MNRKLKNTLALVVVWILLAVFGFGYNFFIQQSSVKKKTKELNSLKAFVYDPNVLKTQLEEKIVKAATLDSVLAARKFNIPKNLSVHKFYDFINSLTSKLSGEAKLNIEYAEQKQYKEFFYYLYKITGVSTFSDFFQLVYAIEKSKELKKIKDIKVNNFIYASENDKPKYLVSFTILAGAYFSDNDRFTTGDFLENNLTARSLYDVFYPLIRTEIPPNYDMLLDVQGARLLALVPEGAFVSDSRGNSYLLMEGDAVYLGYLTKIDYTANIVRFILNKGGIVEKIELELEKEIIIKER